MLGPDESAIRTLQAEWRVQTRTCVHMATREFMALTCLSRLKCRSRDSAATGRRLVLRPPATADS